MVKFMCVLVLLAASCYALPVEQTSDLPKLPRPSPINPDVVSDPKPSAANEVTASESHVQRIPASGVKLSAEVAITEQTAGTATIEPEQDKPKRSLSTESTATSTSTSTSTSSSSSTSTSTSTTSSWFNFRRNQPTTSTEQPASTATSSTIHTPVSVQTPVGTTRPKREIEVTAATASPTTGIPKRTTTLSPSSLSASSVNDDKEGPHFVRPVPVEQILKNLAQTEKHSAEHSTTEKAHRSNEESMSSEEKSDEVDHAQEPSHLKNHPVIRQQGA